MNTWRIVDDENNVIDSLAGLSQCDAELQLCRHLNLGWDCYMQEELTQEKNHLMAGASK
jgi:hypothetical protein